MNGFSCLMFIFAGLIFIAGIYLYTGHKSELLLWKVHDIKKFTIEETKKVGFWTIIVGFIPLILAIIGLFLDI